MDYRVPTKDINLNVIDIKNFCIKLRKFFSTFFIKPLDKPYKILYNRYSKKIQIRRKVK